MKSLTETYLTEVANREVSEGNDPLGPGIVTPPEHQEYTAWTKDAAFKEGSVHAQKGKKPKPPVALRKSPELLHAYHRGFKKGSHSTAHVHSEPRVKPKPKNESIDSVNMKRLMQSKANTHELSIKHHDPKNPDYMRSKQDQFHAAAQRYYQRRADLGSGKETFDKHDHKFHNTHIAYSLRKEEAMAVAIHEMLNGAG